MPPTLPHIAIILNTSEIATALLVSLYKLTGDSLADIKAAVTGRRPVVQEDLFSNAFYDGAMVDEDQAVKALAAISNKTRLRIVRLLIVAGAEGLRAGLYR